MRQLLLIAVLLPLAACPPPCRQVCRKVLFDCELDTERIALDECDTTCQQQGALYEIWEDEELQDLFDDHRRCIGRSSCEEIQDGVCYEGFEQLYVFDPTKEPLGPYTLTLRGDFGLIDGAPVVALATRSADGAATQPVTTTATAGGFELVFASALEVSMTYTVDLFVDVDGNGTCAGLESLVSYRVQVVQRADLGDQVVELDRATHADPAACASFAP